MANTVNDVMNVIASPDYGIKNIAGTNQEILAILSGTHNSKNNIHSIVDDVRNLLQSLVDISKKKSIEISDKTPKINPKNIQDIHDSTTKNIINSINNLQKAILKQGDNRSVGVAKLSDKASKKVADAMIKDMEKQNKGGGMAALVDAFKKLKDISLKDLISGKFKLKFISNIFKDAKKELVIKEKDLNNIIKFINAAPEMLKSLKKVGWRIDKIIKNKVIQKLSDTLIGKNSLLTLSKNLIKNKKTFDTASEAAKDIKKLASSLKEAMKDLVFAALWSKLAIKGITSIENVIDNLSSLSTKLKKNKKMFDDGANAAKNITILVGNLLITSIFLTVAVVTAIPALLGALILKLMVNIIIPVAKKLSKNNKDMAKAVNSAILFTAFTGIMAISSLILSTIGNIGLNALIGAAVVAGIVVINIYTFKILEKAQKNIIIGSVMMLLMSVSLLIYGIALGKITKATENVTWKQVGIIATTLVMLALATAVMGEPTTATFISLGSLTMSLMSLGLIVFGTALGKITKATENLKMKQVLLVGGSIAILGLAVAGAGALSILIAFGSGALFLLSAALKPFLETLKNLSKATENLKLEDIDIVKSAMWQLGKGVSKMAILSIPIALGSVALGAMGTTLFVFVKTLKMIKDIGGIPQEEVKTTLNVMKLIGNFYAENPLKLSSLMVSSLYAIIMKPFSNTIKQLNKLTKMGDNIPMKLVYQTLDAMKVISNYYVENPIERSVIKQARRYKRMMKPFGKTLKYFTKLKELGSIPMKLVYQTLDAMKVIANYYVENPIERSIIKQARRYKRMLKPFGKTLKYFGKLKELGSIPMKLVYQTLDTMKVIANYYTNNPIEKEVIKQSERYEEMLEPFGKTMEYLAKIKDVGTIKTESILSIIGSMSYITKFYNHVIITDDVEEKSEFTELAVDNFTKTALKIQDKFTDVKPINIESVMSCIYACRSIINYYSFTFILFTKRKVKNMNNVVINFTKVAKSMKDKLTDYTLSNVKSVHYAITSMSKIIDFFKDNSLNYFQRREAKKTLKILNYMIFSMKELSNIDPVNISSVGDTLLNTLYGVNTVDLGKIYAVTDMFRAFNGINKSESIINKFTESVKEFTTTCQNLMDAMNYNTDAINNIDTFGYNNIPTNENNINNIEIKDYNNTNNNSNGINIINVEEIAKKIAEKINGSLSVDMPDTQVQLLINGTGGNEWVISRY